MEPDGWGKRRQHLIETILALVGVAFIAVVAVAVMYHPASCIDGRQDQKEQGIDCGGPCAYLCSANENPPRVQFIRALSPQPGRTDILAYIDNSNADATLTNVPVTVTIYDANRTLISSKTGTINLPPSSTEPLFVPDFYTGTTPIAQAFLTFASTSLPWMRAQGKPTLPIPSNIQIQDGPTPRITATLTNPTALPLENVRVVATVFDALNNAIGASQTVVPELPAQGSSPLIFTWNQEFPGTPVRVEILRAF